MEVFIFLLFEFEYECCWVVVSVVCLHFMFRWQPCDWVIGITCPLTLEKIWFHQHLSIPLAATVEHKTRYLPHTKTGWLLVESLKLACCVLSTNRHHCYHVESAGGQEAGRTAQGRVWCAALACVADHTGDDSFRRAAQRARSSYHRYWQEDKSVSRAK